MNLTILQKEVAEWGAKNFPDQPTYIPLLGLVEETGELSHAHIKGEQGIRHTTAEIYAMKKDAVADIMIYLVHYCEGECIMLDEAVEETWAKVKQRDWQKNKLDADKHVS